MHNAPERTMGATAVVNLALLAAAATLVPGSSSPRHAAIYVFPEVAGKAVNAFTAVRRNIFGSPYVTAVHGPTCAHASSDKSPRNWDCFGDPARLAATVNATPAGWRALYVPGVPSSIMSLQEPSNASRPHPGRYCADPDVCTHWLDSVGSARQFFGPWSDEWATIVAARVAAWAERFAAAGGALDLAYLDFEGGLGTGPDQLDLYYQSSQPCPTVQCSPPSNQTVGGQTAAGRWPKLSARLRAFGAAHGCIAADLEDLAHLTG